MTTQLHTPSRRVATMDMDLWMAAHGVTVVEVDMPGTMWGCYCLRGHAVVLRPGLTDMQRRAALMHEAQHILRGDHGHQGRRVEDGINETVACQMVDLMEYARAETEYGWNDARDAADLGGKRPTLHSLRHSHASWLIAQGVPLTVIQRRLGHESIKITSDTYGHLALDAWTQAAAATSLALSQALPELGG